MSKQIRALYVFSSSTIYKYHLLQRPSAPPAAIASAAVITLTMPLLLDFVLVPPARLYALLEQDPRLDIR